MYEEKLVRLRSLKREDMITAKDYMNDSEVRKNVQGGIPFPFTLEDEYKFYEGISGMKDTYTFAIESMEKRYLGGCGINQIDWKNSVATIGIFIGVRQEIYREGRYHDDIVMGLLRDEYKKG